MSCGSALSKPGGPPGLEHARARAPGPESRSLISWTPRRMRAFRVITIASMLALLALVAVLSGQGTAPPMPLMVLSRDSRFALPTTIVGGQEMVALDDLTGPFRIAIREDPLANAVRVTYKDRF